ncbi:sensor histidine kinase [Spirosoma aerolatum]|uniref:sensor histidine kinase n=1 Tax=Spirosoma aerolatum TaxID=1211326 RepID=UPI0009AD28F0|nr:HAMP domain-containing sensor histidine kinase [Spirosoma aerolatum]
MIQRNAQRLLKLINQLLDLSKLEAGQLQAESKPGELTAFFRTLASSFSSFAESRHIPFTFSQTQTPGWVAFDHHKLETVVTNLLANAFKLTPAGQTVTMTLGYAPDQLTFRVADTGISIAADHLAHIFERFYQVDGNTNRP